MRHFDIAVKRFVEAFENGENIDSVWIELREQVDLNEADLQRAVDRAVQLTDEDY